jgi:ferredoxin
MPTVRFAGKSVECLEGANLRSVLVRARLPLYNGAAQAIHCRGLGTCGTCAVQIDGEVSEPSPAERRRMALPPHKGNERLRLACQVTVLGDLEVTKYQGLFGQRDEPAATPTEDKSR